MSACGEPALYPGAATAGSGSGACDWWVAEIDGDRRIAFGYVNLGDDQNAEWGYMDLTELRGIAIRLPSGLPLVVERDLGWTPTRFANLR